MDNCLPFISTAPELELGCVLLLVDWDASGTWGALLLVLACRPLPTAPPPLPPVVLAVLALRDLLSSASKIGFDTALLLFAAFVFTASF